MIYEKDTMQDGTVYEKYEGTPREILELMNCMPRELEQIPKEISFKGYTVPTCNLDEESIAMLRKYGAIRTDKLEDIIKTGTISNEEDLTYDQEDAINFIYKKTGEAMRHYSKEGIKEILEAEEDYMRSMGIIED